ncbi:class I SAM-dependent methyltransferase [Undibacterium sp. RuTC16W]|uniref:class I SAM-dependent methyltransferase n=1 Tax=Undibacterium sp. RuTC16W TaxID=3413048 RepID=UPI003BF15532
MQKNIKCTVCGALSPLYDVVDFNKSCEEPRGKFLELSGNPVYYALCSKCGFCFSPEISNWSLEEFEEKIYNNDYINVDPDYVQVRPKGNAANLIAMFGSQARFIKHLDYGGGSGLLSSILNESNWQSTTYDPFVDRSFNINELGKFDLITAYEVFEHVPDPHHLMSNISSLLSNNGILLFSTLLTDGQIRKNERLSWWYASPRNGHISLFSKNSLMILAQRYGYTMASFSDGFHVFFKKIPAWAKHVICAN